MLLQTLYKVKIRNKSIGSLKLAEYTAKGQINAQILFHIGEKSANTDISKDSRDISDLPDINQFLAEYKNGKRGLVLLVPLSYFKSKRQTVENIVRVSYNYHMHLWKQ